MGKLFIKSSNGFHPLDESVYEEEDKFQEFLFENPSVMGITNDDGEPIRMIPIAREVPVVDEAGIAFSMDLVCLDHAGVVTIVEVKRHYDTRIRREVVGQIFDYASQLCYSGEVGALQQDFEMKYVSDDYDAKLKELLNIELSYDDYWRAVKTNLQARKVRLIIAADGIPDNLKRVIEFLNGLMDPTELLGVDLHKFSKGEMEVFSSEIIGRTEEAEVRKRASQPMKVWDRQSFLEDMEKRNGRAVRERTALLLEWCDSHGIRVTYGGKDGEAKAIPVVDLANDYHFLFAIITNGRFYFWFQYYRPPFKSAEWRQYLMDEFNPVLKEKLDMARMTGRPSFELSAYDDNGWAQVMERFERFLNEIRKTDVSETNSTK